MKIDDIARLANISKSAVSLALNGKPGVSETTRQKVLEIVEEYNYIPLRNHNKKMITENKIIRFVACYDDDNDIVTRSYQSLPFFNELLNYLHEDVKNYPFTFLISTINSNTFLDELKGLENEQPSDGFIVLGTNLREQQIKDIMSIQQNLVVLDTCFPNLNCDFITMNNYQGAYNASMSLIEKGHRSIGLVKGNPTFYNFMKREKGFLDALNRHGLSLKKEHILNFPAMVIRNQIDDFPSLKKFDKMPTAFFCENDYIAISLIKTLKSFGYMIPEDISVIGFDDISETTVISPELTTMRVRKDVIAKEALRLLSQKFAKEKDLSQHVFVNTTLVERESCASLIKE
ncbi:MAG: LacI family DNA-binding transcriptional regulator [Breznakia sp.]